MSPKAKRTDPNRYCSIATGIARAYMCSVKGKYLICVQQILQAPSISVVRCKNRQQKRNWKINRMAAPGPIGCYMNIFWYEMLWKCNCGYLLLAAVGKIITDIIFQSYHVGHVFSTQANWMQLNIFWWDESIYECSMSNLTSSTIQLANIHHSIL